MTLLTQLEESRIVYDIADELAMRVMDAPLDRLKAADRARIHDAAAIAVRMLRPAWLKVAIERAKYEPNGYDAIPAINTFIDVLSGKLLLTEDEQATIDEGDE